MCGRYVLAQVNLEERFQASLVKEGPVGPGERLDRVIEENYNASPSQVMPTITRNSPNKITFMKWGLIPFWAKDPRIGFKMINARAEGIGSKPAFREPFKKRRCLVPASGFYEWKRINSKEKVPYYIFLKSRELLAFAGLYDIWKDAEGKEIKSFTIITVEPNKAMSEIHNRMPAILKMEDEQGWLDQEAPITLLQKMLKPIPDELMDYYVVSISVNSPRNNNSELLKRVS
ncbi:hypothetical protein A3F07_03175 [candidate division WWE3 bacterium RIFCSPHIGHO2_12_FULL_38_15]|uniref:Abasic site processing protein n=1 Tax=candidate division WWE3 bacterium RIFCSPHIGHO2_02_FULL_38_14 TaxID=1802620 RepID=A0A1F4V9L5_UNCKA|nr:MAG: hypothetical protein A2793_04175 [candidate division WWE3 bacterium RIFCSPHIGHO2_01_FULL_38_45]OGC49471.1 MAG: hypothetical protein A3F07_03175 [candidate division WWE3 bacterium RIFCSPHIGHO2_12_FULL_38_15]OGC52718.1 MAG: hypothetical protein A3B64_00900 [candidate division WWE3 bacterium RIFCSPLOWO2_01_FULL_37_24]OGC53912.1 MAG: hypothetical protein A3D91_03955 [candidate division WWE3 bacterium RIFCSPHIGHO2_02_FULL_38_14]